MSWVGLGGGAGRPASTHTAVAVVAPARAWASVLGFSPADARPRPACAGRARALPEPRVDDLEQRLWRSLGVCSLTVFS